MLGDSSAVLGEAASSGDAVAVPPLAASTAATTHDGAESVAATAAAAAAGGSNSGDEDRARGEDGDRSFGGNRWPRQETLALLKIRSDMDVAFRDASVKGPLWEEVSRKLAKLGYHRSAKKCKEKFENVYKYHKRTKDGRSGKSEGKTYRFFDQLEALEHNPSFQSTTSAKAETALPASPVSVVAASASTVPSTTVLLPPLAPVTNTTVPSTTATLPVAQGIVTPPSSINLTVPSYSPSNFAPSTANPTIPSSFPSIPTDLFLSNSSSSSTSSDETLEGRRKRKRKWKDFFERLMKEVIEKQEDLQKRFLEAIEKREHERMVREEAWRMQEMARINREREILAQERSIAAAKDAAVMAFLQKIAEQQNLGQALNNINIPQPQLQPVLQQAAPAPPPVQQAAIQQHSQPLPAGPPAPQAVPQQQVTSMEITKRDNGDNFMAPSSSRWPKVEVQALIKLRTDLDAKYQENGPKGPLWEEISSEMRKIGYNRSAKRCKEKWENINKYFKKVKESNKKRPEDSKTCPYFHQLDALYREKHKLDNPTSSVNQLNKPPENINMMTPLMVRPEQQWPPQQNTRPGPDVDVTMEEAENDLMNRHNEDDDDDSEEEDEDDEDDDEGGGNYEIVASKPASGAGGE